MRGSETHYADQLFKNMGPTNPVFIDILVNKNEVREIIHKHLVHLPNDPTEVNPTLFNKKVDLCNCSKINNMIYTLKGMMFVMHFLCDKESALSLKCRDLFSTEFKTFSFDLTLEHTFNIW